MRWLSVLSQPCDSHSHRPLTHMSHMEDMAPWPSFLRFPLQTSWFCKPLSFPDQSVILSTSSLSSIAATMQLGHSSSEKFLLLILGYLLFFCLRHAAAAPPSDAAGPSGEGEKPKKGLKLRCQAQIRCIGPVPCYLKLMAEGIGDQVQCYPTARSFCARTIYGGDPLWNAEGYCDYVLHRLSLELRNRRKRLLLD